MGRGIIFSSDALLASLAVLFSLYFLFAAISPFYAENSYGLREAEKYFFASALAESIVKNHNELNPELGAAYYNQGKKRPEANLLNPALLAKIHPVVFGKFTLSGLYARSLSGKGYFFNGQSGSCISVERFVLLGPAEKAVLGVVVCEN